MLESKPPHADLDPTLLAAQVAALADHLHRAGIQRIPKADPERVAVWGDRMIRFDAPSSAVARPVSDSPLRQQPTTSRVASSLTSPPSTARPEPPTGFAISATGSSSQPIETTSLPQGPYAGPSLPVADRQAQLDLIRQRVTSCVRCEQLASCRNTTVFGEGNAMTRFAFFGEAPGADEDRTGRPFVGRAGELLTKMIEACKLRRDDVYILNTIKCRPPGNRNPEPDEIQNCREYYQQQLSILRPEYIVCLGAVSAQELLQSKLPVGRLRGKLHRYFESKVLVTYHPAYLLRNPSAKKAAWEDLQIMLRDAKIAY
jgi:DNA polymerase